jgi:PPIC-type PPIASE domain
VISVKILREPLLHFLLLGAIIFAVYGFVTRHETYKPGEIVVTQGTIDNLITGFTRTWQRPPTQQELQGLVRDHIREEAAYREALALGLDRDDMIVRRRLQQKLEFLSDELATRTEPTEQELQNFLQSHRALFETEPVLSFRQIYFNPQLHGTDLHRDATRVLEKLRGTGVASLADLGDPCLLDQDMKNVSLSDVKKTFGDQVASTVSRSAVGVWEGPILSGYGVHLIYVEQRTDSRVPVLNEIREQVRRAWLDEKRQQATDKFYRALLNRYEVTIKPLEEKKLAQVR